MAAGSAVGSTGIKWKKKAGMPGLQVTEEQMRVVWRYLCIQKDESLRDITDWEAQWSTFPQELPITHVKWVLSKFYPLLTLRETQWLLTRKSGKNEDQISLLEMFDLIKENSEDFDVGAAAFQALDPTNANKPDANFSVDVSLMTEVVRQLGIEGFSAHEVRNVLRRLRATVEKEGDDFPRDPIIGPQIFAQLCGFEQEEEDDGAGVGLLP